MTSRGLTALACAALAGAPFPAFAQEEATQVAPVQAAALQPRTARFILRPPTLRHPVQIDVTAPPASGSAGDKLPAIYVLDGGYDMIGQMAGFIIAGGEMAPAYVISIGYPNPNGSHIGERNTDLSHVRAPYVPGGPEYGGGGAAFEAFLIGELKPALEARLPLDPDKAVLFGHSLGGLFAATVLANSPEAFAGYLIASAPLDRDRDIVDKVRAAAPRGAGRRVYVSYTPEDVDVFEAGALGPALAEAGSTFEVRDRLFEEEKHRSSFLRVPQDAFPFLLPPPPREAPAPRPEAVQLEPAALARFAGTFQLSPTISMVVRMADGTLHARSTNEPEFELVPMSDREFLYRDPGVEARIRFTLKADGAVDELVIVQGAREIIGTRVTATKFSSGQ